jgi:hypothetical protein
MTRGKTAKLQNGGAHQRSTGDRQPVAIAARCTIGRRAEEEVLVTDLGTPAPSE